MAGQAPSHGELRDSFAVHNLERLASYPPPLPNDGDPEISTCKIALDILKGWSAKNKASIDFAIAAQAFGGKKDINWKTAFLPFMESIAVYLRDWGSLREAWETYHAYKQGGRNDEVQRNIAISRYHDAYNEIRELAKEWNMDYMNFCDFVSDFPDGHPTWDGPFCGGFYTTDTQKDKPFIGVAFKGTNPLQPREVLVDYNYQLMDGGSLLADTQVSTGVWTGLFGEFQNPNPPPTLDAPFTVILDKMVALAGSLDTSTGPVRIHVTGHSLGGSYSTLCYPVMAKGIETIPSSKVAMGDEYTFGAPRVGSQNFAIFNRSVVTDLEGQSWRIVNNQDIVPQVPPTSLKKQQLDFCHVDQGQKIFKNQLPQPIPSEIGGPLPPVYDIKSWEDFVKAVKQSTDHLPNFYKTSIVYAIEHTG